MNDPSHDPIVNALQAAWTAEEEGRYGDAEQVIHVLHITSGTPAVEAVADELHPTPAPREVRHA